MLIKLIKSVSFKEAHIENHPIHLIETFAVKLLQIIVSDVSPKQVLACTLLIELTTIINFSMLRGEKLNYKSCTSLLLRKSQNLLFLAPEVQRALKVYRVCSIHVFFKCFEPCPYLVCHVTTIENV